MHDCVHELFAAAFSLLTSEREAYLARTVDAPSLHVRVTNSLESRSTQLLRVSAGEKPERRMIGPLSGCEDESMCRPGRDTIGAHVLPQIGSLGDEHDGSTPLTQSFDLRHASTRAE